MTVRPTPSGQIPGIRVSHTSRPGVGNTPQRPGDASSSSVPDGGRDDVRISDQARELQTAGAPAASTPELSPARMREVLQRLSDGHYDRPEVQREVLRRLARDL
jgi:hypothetical protein